MRRLLQKRIDELKDLKTLNPGEQKELEDGGEKLRILFAAVADDVAEAERILKDPLAELKRIQDEEAAEIDTKEEVRPISQFYVNERVENMVELAETSRLDGRRTDNPHIFLAKQKPFLGFMISTQWYSRILLIGLSLAFLLPATYLFHRSLTRR